MQISRDVLEVLSSLSIQGVEVKITQKLDRALYIRVDKVLQALGGTWTRKVQAHIFEGDAGPRIDYAITTGEVETNQDVGFFVTPDALCGKLVDLADVQGGHWVLEPSAGTGSLVDYILGRGANVLAVERDLHRRQLLIQNRRMIHDWCAVRVVKDCDDFLDLAPARVVPAVDRVVMNPPFLRVGKGDHLAHVRHAFEFLRAGGILVSVLPASVTFRLDWRHQDFRQWAQARGTIEPLPEGSFKTSGTNVNTCVVRLVKP